MKGFFILILSIIAPILFHILHTIKIKKEWVFIFYGLLALLLFYSNIKESQNFTLCWLLPGAALGLLYTFLFIYYVLLNRVRFDQVLVSGNFLTRVILLALFFPFLLATLGLFLLGSPRELTFYGEETSSFTRIAKIENSNIYIYDKAENDCLEKDPPNMLWSTFFHLMDPGNQDMATGKGRLWAALIAISGMILLNGLLVSSLIGYFDKRKDLWVKGGTRYGSFLFYHPHYVVIGGNDMACGIIKQLLTHKGETTNFNNINTITGIIRGFFDREKPYILVQTSRDVEKFRRELFSTLTEEEKKRIIIYYGSRTSIEDIEDLKLESAKEVYILGEETRTDDIESHHDTINMECMELILEAFKKTQRVQALTRLTARIKEIQKLIKKEEELIKEEEKQNEVIKGHKNNIEILKKEKEEILEAFKKTQRVQALTRLTARIKEIPELIKKKEELIKEEEKKNEVIKGHKNNIEILKEEKKEIEKQIITNRLKLECRIMFEYQTTFSVFQFYDIDNTTSSYINFKPFNYYEMWAQKVLINKEINGQKIKDNASEGGYLPLEGADGIKQDSDDYVHLFIVGMSRMGIAMAVEAAHLAHYPNYVTKNIRTKITFIDKNAAEEKEFFMGRLKSLFDLSHWRYGKVDERSKLVWEEKHEPAGYDYLGGDFLDIEWEFVNGGIEVPAVQDYIQYSATPQAKITIAICLPESSRAHAAAMYLSRGIYESTAVQQILVYNRYGNAIIDAITKSGNIHPYCGKFKSFGHAAGCYVEQNIIDSEKIGKEINAAYEKINISDEDKQKKEKVKYKGKSSVANTWSSIYNGNTLWTKLRSIDYDGTGLNDSDIMVLAEVEHNRWNTEELIMNFVPLTIEEQQNAKQLNNFNKDKLKG